MNIEFYFFTSWFAVLMIGNFAPSVFSAFWRSFSRPVNMKYYRIALLIGFLTL